jgi:hypothetical protein
MAAGLGFFSVDAGSSSESEEDKEVEENTSDGLASHTPSKHDKGPHSDEGDDKLPSPDTLFKTVKRPEFLRMEEDIDWYDLIMKRDQESDAFYALSSVPPPSSLESKPVRYTSGDKRPQSTDSNPTGTDGNKAKKEKTDDRNKREETFKQKEKRKRDLGQSSRGKSYVEEEKRILREGYSSGAGLGFD